MTNATLPAERQRRSHAMRAAVGGSVIGGLVGGLLALAVLPVLTTVTAGGQVRDGRLLAVLVGGAIVGAVVGCAVLLRAGGHHAVWVTVTVSALTGTAVAYALLRGLAEERAWRLGPASGEGQLWMVVLPAAPAAAIAVAALVHRWWAGWDVS